MWLLRRTRPGACLQAAGCAAVAAPVLHVFVLGIKYECCGNHEYPALHSAHLTHFCLASTWLAALRTNTASTLPLAASANVQQPQNEFDDHLLHHPPRLRLHLALTKPFHGASQVGVLLLPPTAYCSNEPTRLRGSVATRVRCLQVCVKYCPYCLCTAL